MSSGHELSAHDASVTVVVILAIVAWVCFWVHQHVEGKVSGWAAFLGVFAPLIPVLAYGLFFLK